MPTLTDLSDLAQRFDVQNQAQFSKYSVYFVLNQIKFVRHWSIFGDLYATKDWKENMGPTMQGVRVEPTPITRAFFRPQAVTARANKDVFDQRENQERASVFWHKFESKLIYFLRNWQDFIKDQIKPAMADIDRQIVVANEIFNRTVMWDRAPYVYVCGVGMVAAPHSGPPDYTATPKSADWIAGQLASVDVDGLTAASLHNAYLAATEDLGVLPFNGSASGEPKENDILQGNYVLVTDREAYGQIIWDPAYERLRSQNDNHLTGKFKGPLFGNLLCRAEQYPIRFKADGSAPQPETFSEITGDTYPNPEYTGLDSGLYGVAWLLGAEAYNTVKIGPPPEAFRGGASAKQVKGMNWNGKTYLTDNILLKDSSNNYDTNSYGEYLRGQGTLVMGSLPARPRNAIPILYRRKRVSEAP